MCNISRDLPCQQAISLQHRAASGLRITRHEKVSLGYQS